MLTNIGTMIPPPPMPPAAPSAEAKKVSAKTT
jgi:hypothetical protein